MAQKAALRRGSQDIFPWPGNAPGAPTTHQQALAAEEAWGSWAGPERVNVEVYRETQMRPAARCSWGRCLSRFSANLM